MIRRRPITRRAAKRIARETIEESQYKVWLHFQPCVITGEVGERVQASHCGKGGMGQKKGTWFHAIPMRYDIHQQWGERNGWFLGWTDLRREDFAAQHMAGLLLRWAAFKAEHPHGLDL